MTTTPENQPYEQPQQPTTPPPPPQPAYSYYPQAQPYPRTNGLAIAAMVLGIVWVYWLGSILAVIFGHVALRQIGARGESGRGMAIAGLVLGYIGVGVMAIVLIGVAAASSGTGY